MTPAAVAPSLRNRRPLIEQVEESLFDFFELRFEADLRAADFGFQRALTALQARITNQLRGNLRCTQLREMLAPKLDVRGVRAQSHPRARSYFFERYMHHPLQEQRIHLRLTV